ncbi:hypothetical protein J2S43_006297 [Catenuloplanes nepalensis]|uniref:Uncharacterized protein n=1 Tax=Catenuloplanes nepalensis TaxID=587533 RepID=A0ABT9N276_9ACTN|nr:hypothetical protein [Catenuloplanes nepalensis]MDP9797785.1 hypothetical protein [Catenuloplanes nepalensis]
MTPDQAAAAAKAHILRLGGAFAEDPLTLQRARRLGLSGWAYYVAARGGALGDVRADTVAAALGFIAPDAVSDGWDAAATVLPPSKIAAEHLTECARWGVERLSTFPRLARLIELCRRVVLAADPAGLPLFAAWRAMPVPDQRAGGHAAILLHLLREHRTGAHLIAARVSGLSPLEAVISGPEGEAGAVAYGWQPPYPKVPPLVRRRLWADAVTDRIAGQAYEVLSLAERAELLGLLESATALIWPDD